MVLLSFMSEQLKNELLMTEYTNYSLNTSKENKRLQLKKCCCTTILCAFTLIALKACKVASCSKALRN